MISKINRRIHANLLSGKLSSNSQLFELLAMSGMLMDYNWTEILKRREHFRYPFHNFLIHYI